MKDYIIVKGSMGNYLDPPGYPTHYFYAETDLKRKKENRGSMSLEYAAYECEYIDNEIKEAAQKLFEEWKQNKPLLESKEVQDWIIKVLEHYTNLWSQGESYIQKFYPEYKTTALQIEKASQRYKHLM